MKILLVGTGIFNATLYANLNIHHQIDVIEKRYHLGGNCHTEHKEGITIHKYGAHIFHTNSERVWSFVNMYAKFNNFVNSPVAINGDNLYNLPFNMNTFAQMFHVYTPNEVQNIIKTEIASSGIDPKFPKNLEEKAISMVGTTIYEKLIKHYTEKQWCTDCKNLDPAIISRIPLRFTYDNNYFNSIYQGIPISGYTMMIANMFEGADIQFNTDFIKNRDEYLKKYDLIFYSGSLDEFFGYKLGRLPYRYLEFKTMRLDEANHQGVAVVNYTDTRPYTRTIEHKFFNSEVLDRNYTYLTIETPIKDGVEPYYPIINAKNKSLYLNMKNCLPKNVIPCGRLGSYSYIDMDKAIDNAINLVHSLA